MLLLIAAIVVILLFNFLMLKDIKRIRELEHRCHDSLKTFKYIKGNSTEDETLNTFWIDYEIDKLEIILNLKDKKILPDK